MKWSREFTFEDRRDAGRQLARGLERFRNVPRTIVLGLPRGGVVVGCEIALVLRAPLDVLVTRKLGTPGNPELAMGALAETGYRHLNQEILEAYGISPGELEDEITRQQQEIQRRVERYRQGRGLPSLEGWTVVLVDDGIATGATFYASLAALRDRRVAHLVAAVPVAPQRERDELQGKVDEMVLLQTPDTFYGIGQFYDNFTQVTDEEVLRCLDEVKHALKEKPAGPPRG